MNGTYIFKYLQFSISLNYLDICSNVLKISLNPLHVVMSKSPLFGDMFNCFKDIFKLDDSAFFRTQSYITEICYFDENLSTKLAIFMSRTA